MNLMFYLCDSHPYAFLKYGMTTSHVSPWSYQSWRSWELLAWLMTVLSAKGLSHQTAEEIVSFWEEFTACHEVILPYSKKCSNFTDKMGINSEAEASNQGALGHFRMSNCAPYITIEYKTFYKCIVLYNWLSKLNSTCELTRSSVNLFQTVKVSWCSVVLPY